MSASGGNAASSPLLVVISGPSGVGKDAVVSAMHSSYPEIFYAVTATTRPKRPGELDGRDYIFLTPERFQELLDRGEFLEHAEVYGRWYGIPKQFVRQALRQGRDVVLRIDVQGAATVRRLVPDALLIFLVAPRMAELERRLKERKTESPEQLALRIETARREMQQADWFDAVVVNETGAVNDTVEKILHVMEEARCRIPARVVSL